MTFNVSALVTTARKALAAGVAIATAVEATGAITGHVNSILVQAIAVGGAVLTASAVYAIPNARVSPQTVRATDSEAMGAIMDQFNNGGVTNAV